VGMTTAHFVAELSIRIHQKNVGWTGEMINLSGRNDKIREH